MDVELPAIYCPFPVTVHPAVERITQESLDWAGQFDFYPDEHAWQLTQRARFSWWHGVATPNADEDRILPFAKFLLLEGSICEFWSPHWAGRPGKLADLIAGMIYTLKVPGARVLTGHPRIMAAMEDLVPQLQALATPVQYRRWLECFRAGLLSTVRENWINAEKIVLSVNDYLTLRTQTMLMAPCFFSNDIVCERDVPDHLFDRADVRALHQLALVHVGVRNDTRNCRLDASTGQCNFIPSLMNDTGCSMTEAITHSLGILDSVMHRCVEIRYKINKDNVPDTLREHLSNVLGVTSATIAYEQRVRHSWYQYEGEMAQEFTDSPSSTAPLAYPSVAWCWNV